MKIRSNWFVCLSLVSITFFGTAVLAQDRMEEQPPTVEDYASYFSSQFTDEDENVEMSEGASIERQKTIASINALLERSTSETENTMFWRKLAHLYVAEHNYTRKLTNKNFHDNYKQWVESGKKTEEPKISHDRTFITNAANTFRDLVNKAPKHLVKDEDMFYLILSLTRISSESTPNYYKLMSQRFPESKLTMHAKLVLGEYYFGRREYSLALDQYKEVSEKKDSPVCAYAFYKIGWSHFALRENEKAKKEFHSQKAVIALKLASKLVEKNKLYRGSYDLKEETLKDLSLFWAELRDVATAKEFFEQEKRRDHFFATLERLAQIYGNEGNYQKGIAIIEQLLREDPTNLENPRRYLSLLHYRETSGIDPSFVASDLERMKSLFFGQTIWTKANSEKEANIKEAEDLVENILSGYGTAYHQEALKGKKPHSIAAVKIYELYLATFPKSSKCYDFRYFLADLLTQLHKLDEAATQYYLVTQADPAGKRLKDAAFNAVASMNEVVSNTRFPETPPVQGMTKPFSVPPEKEKFIKMMDNYATLLPGDEKSVSMRYFSAEILFQYGHVTEALPRYRDIIFKSAETEQAGASAQQSFEYYKAKHLFDEGVTLAKDIHTANLPLNREVGEYVTETYKYVLFQLAESLSQQKKYNEAGDRNLEFQTLFSSDASADFTLVKSFNNYLSAGNIERGIVAANTLLRDYQSSRYKVDAYFFLATASERTTNFTVAAQKFQEFAMSFPSDSRASEALLCASRLHRITGKEETSAQLLLTLIQNYPERADTVTYFELAEILDEIKRPGESRAIYEKFLGSPLKKSEDDVLFAQARASEMTWNEGNKEKARSSIKTLANKLPENKSSAINARKVAARVLFKWAEEGREILMRPPIKVGASLKEDISAIQKRLDELKTQYETVARMGVVEYSLGSLYRIGEMYDTTAEKLLAASASGAGTAEAKAKGAAEVDKVALPLKSEAEKYLLLGLKLAKKSTAVTPWTGEIYDKLSKIRPDQYKRVDEIPLDPSYINHPFKLNDRVSILGEGR